MTKLRDLASLIRSKNAGPFQLTIDIMFEHPDSYQRVVGSGAVNPQTVSAILGTDPKVIVIFHFEPALAIKVTLPRLAAAGAPDDVDLFGGQLFGPLAELEIPDRPAASALHGMDE